MVRYQYDVRASDDEEEDDDKKKNRSSQQQKKKPYNLYEQAFEARQLHFYISEEITAPEEYTDMIHRILVAGPNDVIFIHLNTKGGRLDTGIQIINAMQDSQAKIVTVLESMAFSLGTLIFLAGDEMVVHDHCMIMFHTFEGGLTGKGQELAAQVDATVKWFSSLAKKIYIPFLSEQEFNRILKGEDLWMHSPEIRKRLERMIKEINQVRVKTPHEKKVVIVKAKGKLKKEIVDETQ